MVLAATLMVVALVAALPAATGDTIADRVLGQSDFTDNAPNTVGAQSLDFPVAVAVDNSATPRHLYVIDGDNSRVLGYKNAESFADGSPADLVIGQPDFASAGCNLGSSQPTAKGLSLPGGVAVNPAGNLYVADTMNSRVLEYSNPFAALAHSGKDAGQSAAVVFGQPDFASGSCNQGGNPGADTLCDPAGVAADLAGNLYVADSGNNRMLEYNTPLASTAALGSGDTIADLVFGQGASGKNFSSNAAATGTTGLNAPSAVSLDGLNDVYVADSSNSRVLEYNENSNPPTFVTANTVFGQPGFSSNSCNGGGSAPTAVTLCFPQGLVLDSAGDLFVADEFNNRMLEYFSPLASNAGAGSGDTIADRVFGQPVGDFTAGVATRTMECPARMRSAARWESRSTAPAISSRPTRATIASSYIRQPRPSPAA